MRLGAKVRLLVVEDDPMLGRAVGRALSARGLSVVTVTSCGAARVAEGAFDGGVFDIDLPDGDGITLAEDLLRAGVVSAVAFFSGRTEAETVQRARLLGPFIPKSEGVQAVVDAVPEMIVQALRALAAGGEDTPVDDPSFRARSGIRRKIPR